LIFEFEIRLTYQSIPGTSTESKVDEIVKEEADQKEVIMNDAVQDDI
jgi:hypothetical protein